MMSPPLFLQSGELRDKERKTLTRKDRERREREASPLRLSPADDAFYDVPDATGNN
jgi:hypothetical protein